MTVAVPSFAAVRPRVVVKGTNEAQLLEEVLADIAEEFPLGLVIAITGSAGSGKSTALAHAAASLAHDDRVVFLDEPTAAELHQHRREAIVVATMPRSGRGIQMALEPWRRDELIEYLLANHHEACASVLSRLGPAANWPWLPEIACIFLDRFAADEALRDPIETLVDYVAELVSEQSLRSAVGEFCVNVLTGNESDVEVAHAKLIKTACPLSARRILRHEQIQLPVAARRLTANIEKGEFGELERPLLYELVELVGRQCGQSGRAMQQLRQAVESMRSCQPMSASILVVADTTWRPIKPRQPWCFTGGIFADVQWPDVNITRSSIASCDFTDANLGGAILEECLAWDACFDGASLRGANLSEIKASRTSFRQANLHRARMTKALLDAANLAEASLAEADLTKADLSLADLSSALLQGADLSGARLAGAKLKDADLSGAVLREANLNGVDLRNVRCDGACFEKADLTHAQMEDVQIPQAQMRDAILRGAYLTGSSLPGADLRGAVLAFAGLAEIEWENADLRGADLIGSTFHMGSSRSGLVGSPIACEGSRTGFYTDDLEDMTFKRPEEIRKANLRGADLRGVKGSSVDFYLVDLRDAKLDPGLLEQARNTGAILEDVAA